MKSPEQILESFHELMPWARFDQWSGICIETGDAAHPQTVCAFFGEDQDADQKLLILRGADPAFRYFQYRTGDWTPEFGLDFATTDGIKINIIEDEVDSYESSKPGHAPEALRLDEKQLMFEVVDAINTLVSLIDAEKVPVFGETEDYCYHLWKVAGTWRAEVREFPDEQFIANEPVEIADGLLKKIVAAKLPHEGVWEAASFYLPATRFQGDQEMFVQCAGVAERSVGTLGILTIESHADPEQEIVTVLLDSIEKQKRIPQFVMVREERVAERLFPMAQTLGIQLRLRRRLRDLSRIRDAMIDAFPEDDSDED